MIRSAERIAILAPGGRDRELIRDMIAAEGWIPTFPTTTQSVEGPWPDVDVIVVDQAWVERSREAIERTRNAAGSEFVPVLLVSPRARALEPLPDFCDQRLVYPTTRADFTARLRSLVRARSESRRIYRSFFENALIGVYRARTDGTILMANRALARMLGHETIEALKESGARIPGLGDTGSASGIEHALAQHGRADGVEEEWPSVNDTAMHVAHSAHIVEPRGRQTEALIEGTIQNVTELARSRRRLARSERFLQSAIDALSAHVAILDPRGVIVSVNRAWRRFEEDTRPPESDDIGTNYLSVCGAAGDTVSNSVADGIGEVIDGTRSLFETEYPCHSPTEFRWFRLVVTPFPEEPPRRTVVAHENITEIKLAQRRFQLLVEGGSEVTIVVDSQGELTYRNPTAERYFGDGTNEGSTFRQLVHPDDRALLEDLPSEPGTDSTLQCRVRHAQGAWRDVEWTVTDMRDEPLVSGYVLHGRDITDRTAMLTELQAREREMREMQKMEAIGQLAGGVAHDFNNLLTTIQANVGLLRDRLTEFVGHEDDSPTELLTEIQRATEQGAFLTRRLLMFSRKEPDAEVEVADLNEILGALTRMLKRVVVETVDLTLDISGAALPIRIRTGEVEQVLTNLVVNAAQAMPHGGRLTVRSRTEVVGEEPVASDAPGRLPGETRRVGPGPYAVIDVIDTGTGIPPEVRERIFEPFFTTKPRGEGTGLGLATVFGIIDRAGGGVEVYSEVGLGSRFSVYFPLVEATQLDTDHEVKARRPVAGGDETLLLVEDEEAVRRGARRGLERLGYTVLEAENGLVALERLTTPEGADVAAIVSDFVMPEMSGLEMARAVHELHPGLPIIITSGYPDAEIDLPEGLRFDTLPKPYDLTELGIRIRMLLEPPGDE